MDDWQDLFNPKHETRSPVSSEHRFQIWLGIACTIVAGAIGTLLTYWSSLDQEDAFRWAHPVALAAMVGVSIGILILLSLLLPVAMHRVATYPVRRWTEITTYPGPGVYTSMGELFHGGRATHLFLRREDGFLPPLLRCDVSRAKPRSSVIGNRVFASHSILCMPNTYEVSVEYPDDFDRGAPREDGLYYFRWRVMMPDGKWSRSTIAGGLFSLGLDKW